MPAKACRDLSGRVSLGSNPHTFEQNTKLLNSPFLWEQSPSTHLLPPSPEQYDSSYSTIPSPTESACIKYPDFYTHPKEDFDQDFKAHRIFDFGSCEDWVHWDDLAAAQSPITTDFSPELKLEPTTPNMRDLGIHGESNQFQNQSNIGNGLSVVFRDDEMEQPLFQTADQACENLCSTPLSWSPPSTMTNIGNTETYSFSGTLSPHQQSRLIAQAMPFRSRLYPSSASPASSPEPEQSNNGRKRKGTSHASEDEDKDCPQQTTNGRHPPVKKTAHKMIEKRYRTNLNEKIAALRDSVPSLRVITKENAKGEEIEEDLDGLTPAQKSNKATVLAKATEYIAHIERRNRALTKDNSTLKSRLEAFEILMIAPELQPVQQQRREVPAPPPQPQQMRDGRVLSRQTSNSMLRRE